MHQPWGFPKFEKTFKVHTDASDFANGGILMQDGHPNVFKSKKLSDVQDSGATRSGFQGGPTLERIRSQVPWHLAG